MAEGGVTASASAFPLHRAVWDNRYQELGRLLDSKEHGMEEADGRGRTPLMLAVTLGHLESTRKLLQHGANVNVVNKGGWTVVQEAVATGDPELLQLVLERRDRQRYTSRVGGIPELLAKLKNAPDFYVEMKWEFTSWVPFLSRMCPSDTYKVYKQGSNVRIDTTLLGFDQSHWVRGNRTYLFSGREDGAQLYEVDHDTRTVYCEDMKLLSAEELETYVQSEEQLSARLTAPLVLTYVDTDKINFERSRGGLWGWGGSDKAENVSGYDCKVFGANNVELITKTRTEHLTEEDKRKAKSSKNPLQSFLGMAEVELGAGQAPAAPADDASRQQHFSANNPCCISPEEYFDPAVELGGERGDIGRPKEMTSKVQRFQAQLWLSENYPLSLQEQVMPIVDLMAISNTHFQKLKDFITCSFPAGFPVKIEIPLFHVLNARVTFGNIFGLSSAVEGITVVDENDRTSCAVDDSVFQVPADYSKLGGQSSELTRRQYEQDDDDQLLQYAIRQSIGNGSGGGGSNGAGLRENRAGEDPNREKEEVDIWEALQGHSPSSTASPYSPSALNHSDFLPASSAAFPKSLEERQLELQIQKAIELSLQAQSAGGGEATTTSSTTSAAAAESAGRPGDDGHIPAAAAADPSATSLARRPLPAVADRGADDLAKALELSQREQEEQARRQKEEEELLEKVLALSMTET